MRISEEPNAHLAKVFAIAANVIAFTAMVRSPPDFARFAKDSVIASTSVRFKGTKD